MSYFGKGYSANPAFDTANIVPVSGASTLTQGGAGKLYILNTPANYTITLPALNTSAAGDMYTFIHNHTTGTVTIQVNGADTLRLFGNAVSSLTITTGQTVSIQNLNGVWYFIEPNKVNTPVQGSNDTTIASTGFVINEFGKHKNYLINGNFDIWQRGTSFAIGSGTNDYTADRWVANRGGAAGAATVSRQSFVLGQTLVPNEPTYFIRFAQTTGGSTAPTLRQKIEGVRSLAGKTVTVSFYGTALANLSVGVAFEQAFGTGGSPSSLVTTNAGTVNVTTTTQKFTITVAVPSISGKTLGTNGDDSLNLLFSFPSGSTFTFDLAQVQVEEGSVSTQFDTRPVFLERSMCFRYCLSIQSGTIFSNGWVSQAGATVETARYNYPVEMRATPTLAVAPSWSVSQASVIGANILNNRAIGYQITGTVNNGSCSAVNSNTVILDAEL